MSTVSEEPAMEIGGKPTRCFLTESSLLVHYDENKPLLPSCDASPYGVGAVLMGQNNRCIQVAVNSRAKVFTTRHRGIGNHFWCEEVPQVYIWPSFYDYL